MTDYRDPELPNSGQKTEPAERWHPDLVAAMEFLENGRSPLPDSADDPAVIELLAHWDQLPASTLQHISDHPVHGPRLVHLKRGEAWLGVEPDLGECPEADELYDFARGPGFVAVRSERRGEIGEHLSTCGTCGELVASLESSPPLPLDLRGADPELGDTPLERAVPETLSPQSTSPHLRLLRTRGRWIPLATAAAVLVTSFVLLRSTSPVGADGPRLPDAIQLRGESSAPLLFPRGKVLAPESPAGSGFAVTPRFELEPVADASLYRIELRQNSGGAFDSGRIVATGEAVTASQLLDHSLAPGHYTWEAWAVVDGLSRPLGKRDFQVLDQPGMRTATNLEARVGDLHDAGFWTDARHVARRLPASPERDEYLDTSPGR